MITDFLGTVPLRDIMTPIILVLAAFGYVRCLSVALWPTLGASVVLAGLFYLRFPPSAETVVGWGGAAILLATALFLSRLGKRPVTPRGAEPARETITAKDHKDIVIDGTNVLYWDNEQPDLATLRGVVAALIKRKLTPVVFLDASSRHHLRDKSLTEKGFAKALGLPENRVTVCPAGTEADAFILQYARDHALPVVSNDRFRDRAQIARKLRLVRGVIAGGKPIFENL